MDLLGALYEMVRTAARGLGKAPILLFVLSLCAVLLIGAMGLADQDPAVMVVVGVVAVVLGLAAIAAWVMAASRRRPRIDQTIRGGRDASVEAAEAQHATGAGGGNVKQTIKGGRRSDVRAQGAQRVTAEDERPRD